MDTDYVMFFVFALFVVVGVFRVGLMPLLAQSGHHDSRSSMSAFGGKADIKWLVGMSAYDPKRTWAT